MKHFRQGRTAGESWWAAIRKKLSGFDRFVTNAQVETKSVAASRIGLFRDRISVREFADIARVG